MVDIPALEALREQYVQRNAFPKAIGDAQLIGELCLHIINNWFLNRTGIYCDAGVIG